MAIQYTKTFDELILSIPREQRLEFAEYAYKAVKESKDYEKFTEANREHQEHMVTKPVAPAYTNEAEEPTVVELLGRAEAMAQPYETIPGIKQTAANRERAIVVTKLQEAAMWYTRARAKETGNFNPADLDK